MAHGKFYRLDLEVTHIIYVHTPPGRISHVIIPNCKGDWEILVLCLSNGKIIYLRETQKQKTDINIEARAKATDS